MYQKAPGYHATANYPTGNSDFCLSCQILVFCFKFYISLPKLLCLTRAQLHKYTQNSICIYSTMPRRKTKHCKGAVAMSILQIKMIPDNLETKQKLSVSIFFSFFSSNSQNQSHALILVAANKSRRFQKQTSAF